MNWQTVVERPFELGESPFWHGDEHSLYWVDIAGRRLHRCKLPGGTLDSWDMPSEPGCIAPARRNGQTAGLVIALRDGVYRALQWGGVLQRLVGASHDSAKTRFNDGKADPLGRFWTGTLYEPRDLAAAQLFCMDARGGRSPALECKARNATVANGLAWSPDGATLYWTDTTQHLIRAWDWDAASNQMTRERVFKQFPLKPPGWQAGVPDMPAYGGRPDGATVDSQGNYWVAMFEGGRVLKLSPDGEVLDDIATPGLCPTMPCFGGDDLQTLHLTSARHGRPAAELQARPLSGCVVSMRVDVAGLPVNFFTD